MAAVTIHSERAPRRRVHRDTRHSRRPDPSERTGGNYWRQKKNGRLLVCNREKMNVEWHAVARSQRMFAVGENLHVPKKWRKQLSQSGARKEISVIAFEQMPGNDAPIVEIRQQLDVRHGKQGAALDDSGDLGDESAGIFRMLEDLDAEGAVEFPVGARQRRGREIDFAKR